MEQVGSIVANVRNWLRSDMRVLRWVFLALYGLLILALLTLSSLGLFRGSDALVTWLIFWGVTLGGQALFIFGAGTIRLCQPIRKRRLWMPILVAAVMFALLVLGLTAAAIELFKLDSPSPLVEVVFFVWLFGSWTLWAPLLWIHVRRRPRMKALSRLTAILFTGSLAELLACVPAHVVTSRRPQCLAGLYTMFGIIAGIYVMLFSFGPAIVLLFLRPQYRREQMEGSSLCQKCEYDLRGTLAAGRSSCPECGAEIAVAQRESWAGEARGLL